MTGRPLEFCAHLARAVRNGTKITTWKPLSTSDIERRKAGFTSADVPFPIGSISQVLEPWGYVGADIVYASSFAPDVGSENPATPTGWRPMTGMRAEKTVLIKSCTLDQLSTITEAEARRAGTVPPDGSTYLAEFERQWRGAYRGAQAWEADPLCWRVAFTLVP